MVFAAHQDPTQPGTTLLTLVVPGEGGAGGGGGQRDGCGRGGEGAGVVIVTVCADKGSPGVTTLATVLGLVWPGPRAVVEADTAGSDLSFRLRPAVNGGVLGGRLAPDPSIAALATAARLGLTDAGPLPYAQDTSLGFRWCRGCCPRNGSGRSARCGRRSPRSWRGGRGRRSWTWGG